MFWLRILFCNCMALFPIAGLQGTKQPLRDVLQRSYFTTLAKSLKNTYEGVQFLIYLQAKNCNFTKIELLHRYFLKILTAGTEEQHCRKAHQSEVTMMYYIKILFFNLHICYLYLDPSLEICTKIARSYK